MHQNEYSWKLKPNCSDTNRKIDCFFPFIYLPIKNLNYNQPKITSFFHIRIYNSPDKANAIFKMNEMCSNKRHFDSIFFVLFFIYDKIRRIREITELRPDIRSHLIKEWPNAFNILSSLDFMLWWNLGWCCLNFYTKSTVSHFEKEEKTKCKKCWQFFCSSQFYDLFEWFPKNQRF